jgi:hypothetical protein
MAKKVNKTLQSLMKDAQSQAFSNTPQYYINAKGEKVPLNKLAENEAAGKKPTPSEYFFVADYDPEDPDMFDNQMVGDPIDYSPEGLQQAIELLTQMKQKNPNYNIYRRKYDEGGGSSEEEIIEDYYNYNFPNKK